MRDKKILIFGDSIVYGAWDLEVGGWVNWLRFDLDRNQQGEDYTLVYNLGISGETSDKTLARFENECRARLDKDDKAIIVFSIGLNDTQDVEGEDLIPLEQFADNIKKLITKAKQFTDKIIFIGLTCVDEPKVFNRYSSTFKRNKSYFNEKIVKFDNELEEICKKEHVQYVKMFDLLTTNDLADGLHPDASGHKKMFDAIFNNVKSLI